MNPKPGPNPLRSPTRTPLSLPCRQPTPPISPNRPGPGRFLSRKVQRLAPGPLRHSPARPDPGSQHGSAPAHTPAQLAPACPRSPAPHSRAAQHPAQHPARPGRSPSASSPAPPRPAPRVTPLSRSQRAPPLTSWACLAASSPPRRNNPAEISGHDPGETTVPSAHAKAPRRPTNRSPCPPPPPIYSMAAATLALPRSLSLAAQSPCAAAAAPPCRTPDHL